MIIAALMTAAMIPCCVVNLATAHTPISGAVVRRAIIGGVNYLLKQERPGSFWERGVKGRGPEGTFSERGGETALVVEALLYVQQTLHLKSLSMFGPALKPAIAMLCHIKPTGNYAVSYQANALALLPLKPAVRRMLRWDQIYLDQAIHNNGAYSYAYFGSPQKDRPFATSTAWDNSNSQYGVLGMWACVHALQRSAPYRYWRLVERHWVGTQFPDGSWGYWGFAGRPPAHQPSAWRKQSMTPAGIASLLIADEYLNRGRNMAVSRGLRWINAHFQPVDSNEYAMYGFERVGLASGLSSFGRHNWYRDFVRTLVNNQNNNGSWGGGFWDADTVSGTAYALLILDRGLNPFLMSKLDDGHHYYGQWNRYPRDVANLASWMSRTTDFPVNWQVVTFKSRLKTWLSAPILYITGSHPPVYSPAEQRKLRHYIDAGGLVLCSCDDASQSFRMAMMKLGEHVMDSKYEFTRLKKTCLLYQMQPWYRNFFINAYGMSNGSRYLWIVAPEDLSRVWQRHAFSAKRPWIFAENLYLYCTGDGDLTNRLKSIYVPRSNGHTNRTLHVTQLKYAGNWNPEPFAWRRYARISRLNYGTTIDYTSSATVASTSARHSLVYITGTSQVALTSQQVSAIKQYLAAGGTLLMDCIGGHASTAGSMRKLVDALVPHASLKRIKASSRLLGGQAGQKHGNAPGVFRKYYMRKHGIKRLPQLYGVRRGKRWVIIFSPLDVGSGLLGTHTWGIDGYSTKYSITLIRSIVAYTAGSR